MNTYWHTHKVNNMKTITTPSTRLFANNSNTSVSNNQTAFAILRNTILSVMMLFVFATAGAQNSMQVDMRYFAGSINNKVVSLNWQTASEHQVSYYEIQRSNDGENFAPFATITAVGQKSQVNNYLQRDDLFLTLTPVVYYRIKMVATNGSANFSRVLSIKTSGKTASNMAAYPSPFNQQLNVAVESNEAAKATVQLTAQDGRVIASFTYSMKKGKNTIVIQQAATLSAGNYFVTVVTDNMKETRMVTKQ
jgi:methionine-rich copper-binding protein CopC